MTALFEMRIRVGGDPRSFSEFAALRDELAKLTHPARPDVDWAKVEQLCLTMFEKNGADLQTVASYTLARSQRLGLEGMAQGVALIETLSAEWSRLWPQDASVRLGILDWLSAHLQSLLRSHGLNTQHLPALIHVGSALECLLNRLDQQERMPVASLVVLRQRVESLISRLEKNRSSDGAVVLSTTMPGPGYVLPVMILAPPSTPEAPAASKKTRTLKIALCLFVAGALIALSSGLTWRYWQAPLDDDGGRRIVGIFQRQQSIREPVRLDSLLLFGPGSAELRPESTKVLINALMDIKARPGWLIVVSAHTDNAGTPERNVQLSHARASAVRDWMQRMGNIPFSCFAVQGFGADQPVADNDTEAGRVKNRRVDIRLVPEVNACPISTLDPGTA